MTYTQQTTKTKNQKPTNKYITGTKSTKKKRLKTTKNKK